MKRGTRKKHTQVEVAESNQESKAGDVVLPPEELKPNIEQPAIELSPIDKRIAESRKLLEVPLDPGQQYFESPEGEIIVGEKGKDRVWCRSMSKGKGGWANPRR